MMFTFPAAYSFSAVSLFPPFLLFNAQFPPSRSMHFLFPDHRFLFPSIFLYHFSINPSLLPFSSNPYHHSLFTNLSRFPNNTHSPSSLIFPYHHIPLLTTPSLSLIPSFSNLHSSVFLNLLPPLLSSPLLVVPSTVYLSLTPLTPSRSSYPTRQRPPPLPPLPSPCQQCHPDNHSHHISPTPATAKRANLPPRLLSLSLLHFSLIAFSASNICCWPRNIRILV